MANGAADCQRSVATIACINHSLHNDDMTPDTADDEVAGDPSYAFKPSLMGAMCQFVLKPDALDWQIGRRSGRIRYGRILAIRLSYRPVTMQSQRFVTEIWSSDNPKIQIVSSSWRSMVEQERLDAGYSAFVGELHRRLIAAGHAPRLSAGLPMATYCVGIAVFSAVLFATGMMLVRALQHSQWAASGVVAIFFAVFSYQLGNYFYRNRPVRYRPDAIPSGVMPKV